MHLANRRTALARDPLSDMRTFSISLTYRSALAQERAMAARTTDRRTIISVYPTVILTAHRNPNRVKLARLHGPSEPL